MEHSTIIGGAQWLPQVDLRGDPQMLKGFPRVLAVKVTTERRYAEEETTIIVVTFRQFPWGTYLSLYGGAVNCFVSMR